VFERHRLPSTGSRWDIRWVSGRGKTSFCVFSLAIMERVLRLAVRGVVVFRSGCPASEGAGV
jgi:hypothetical protein